MKIGLALLAAVVTSVSALQVARADGGFWCWTHPDGESALCAREQEQCEASRTGFNETARSLGQPEITDPCRWQKTAWELVSKRPMGPGHHFPSKKLCLQARDKGDTCRLAR